MRVQTDLCEVSEVLFLNLAYLKLEFLRLGFTLVNRVSETRDLRGQIPRGIWPHQETETEP